MLEEKEIGAAACRSDRHCRRIAVDPAVGGEGDGDDVLVGQDAAGAGNSKIAGGHRQGIEPVMVEVAAIDEAVERVVDRRPPCR